MHHMGYVHMAWKINLARHPSMGPKLRLGQVTQGGITCMLSKEPKYEIACLPALVI